MSSPEHGEEIRAEVQRRLAASAHPYDAFNTDVREHRSLNLAPGSSRWRHPTQSKSTNGAAECHRCPGRISPAASLSLGRRPSPVALFRPRRSRR